MSLIKCPECGAEISEQAPRCPNCGCPASVILEKSMMICSECGCEHERGLANCPKCGFPNPNKVQCQSYSQNGYAPAYQQERLNDHQVNYSKQGKNDYHTNYTEHNSVGFGDAIRICFSEKYATFSGRASRSEYWYFYLFNWLLTFIPACFYWKSYMDAKMYYGSGMGFTISGLILFVISLIMFLPILSATVRRLHDSNKSGACIFLCLIPIIGVIILFVFTLLSSDPHENKYGPKP